MDNLPTKCRRFLEWLSDQKQGIGYFGDVPAELRDEDTVRVCHAQGLVRYGTWGELIRLDRRQPESPGSVVLKRGLCVWGRSPFPRAKVTVAPDGTKTVSATLIGRPDAYPCVEIAEKGRDALAVADDEQAYPASYFDRYGIQPDALRKAADKGRLTVHKGNGNRNHYYPSEVKALWPHRFIAD